VPSPLVTLSIRHGWAGDLRRYSAALGIGLGMLLATAALPAAEQSATGASEHEAGTGGEAPLEGPRHRQREISPERLKGLVSGPFRRGGEEEASGRAEPVARPAPAVADPRPGRSTAAEPAGRPPNRSARSETDLPMLAGVLREMAPGEWRALPGSIRSVAPSAAALGPFWGSGGPPAIPLWSGAAYGDGAFWLWGGGHANYGGNEVYRYDLRTGQWRRFGPWLEHDVDAAGCLTPREAPVSAHAAGGLWWAGGRLWVAGYSGFCRSAGTQQGIRNTWAFDPASGLWQAYPALQGVEPHTAYDAGNNLVYQWSRRHRLDIYDARTLERVAERKGPVDYVPDYTNLVFDGDNRIVYGHAKNRLYAWPVNSDGRWAMEERSYDGMPASVSGMAVRKGKLYFWAGEATVRRFDPASGQWDSFEGPGGPSRQYDRIFSRWLYVPEVDAFLGFSRFDSLYVWKPPADGAGPHKARAAAPVAPVAAEATPPASAPALPVAGRPRLPAASGTPVKWAHDPMTYGGLPGFDPGAVRPSRPPVSSGTVGLDAGMRNTGDRPEIGLVTSWQAALLAGYSEYRDVVLAQASPEVAGKLQWEWEHTYPLYWVPYLLTGDTRYLDRLRGLWKAYQVDYRKRPFGGPMDPLTEREFAWQLRTLAELAKADPKTYKPILENTREFVIKRYVEGGRPGRKVLHNVGPERRDQWASPKKLGMTFWQQSFVGQALAHVVLLGHEEWRPILEHHFQLWRQFITQKTKHVDDGDLFYWSEEEGDLTTWDAIIAVHERPAYLRKQPDDELFDGAGVGIRHIRAQQVLNAVALAAVAKVKGARELHDELKAKIESRARAKGLPMTIRDAVLVP
jgi:hypothetical protein